MDPASKAITQIRPGIRLPNGQFPPGVSGNPAGRPKKSLLMRLMEEEFEDAEFAKNTIDAIKSTMRSTGMAGVLERKHWSDRIDGPVKQEIEFSGRISLETILEARGRMNERDTGT